MPTKKSALHPATLSPWAKERKRFFAWRDSMLPGAALALDVFAKTGKCHEPGWQPEREPRFEEWELHLDTDLEVYAEAAVLQVMDNAIREGVFDTASAVRAFASMYTVDMIAARRHALSRQRIGRDMQNMSPSHLPYTALGVIIGCRAEALRLARLQLALYRKGCYHSADAYPIYFFVLRLMADFLGEEPIALQGESAEEPVHHKLFSCWRGAAEDLIAPSMAACDFHLRRCLPSKTSVHEFDKGGFVRLPISVLLIFKLRQWLGLKNPRVPHSLMLDIFSDLPNETRFEAVASGPDDLTHRLRTRLATDGYDEDRIFASAVAQYPEIRSADNEVPAAESASAEEGPFSSLKLKTFVSPGFGLVFNAPDTWQDASDQQLFRVRDPETGMQVTSSALENQGLSLEEWADARFKSAQMSLPYLQQCKSPYRLHGRSWTGIAAEYQGMKNGESEDTHYFVICLVVSNMLISFSIITTASVFSRNEALYRWLIENRLDIYKWVRMET